MQKELKKKLSTLKNWMLCWSILRKTNTKKSSSQREWERKLGHQLKSFELKLRSILSLSNHFYFFLSMLWMYIWRSRLRWRWLVRKYIYAQKAAKEIHIKVEKSQWTAGPRLFFAITTYQCIMIIVSMCECWTKIIKYVS